MDNSLLYVVISRSCPSLDTQDLFKVAEIIDIATPHQSTHDKIAFLNLALLELDKQAAFGLEKIIPAVKGFVTKPKITVNAPVKPKMTPEWITRSNAMRNAAPTGQGPGQITRLDRKLSP